MDDMSWQVVLLIIGSFVGGGSLTGVVAMALTERLRKTFIAIGSAVTHDELIHNFAERDEEREERENDRNRHWENVLDKVEKRLREAMHSEVGALGNKLTRDYEHLQRELAAFGKGVDLALRQSTDADRRSIETRGALGAVEMRLDGIEKNIDIRLANITSMLDLLTRKNIA